jgi:Pectate lyase superfamily protein
MAVINVRNTPFNAAGDGVTDDTAALQAAFNAAFPPGLTNPANNSALYVPAGNYRITSPLLATIFGGKIFGDGKFATRIFNGAGGTVIQTNNCSFTKFEDMRLSSSGSATIFDLDGDGKNVYVSLQSNTFQNMEFDGAGIGLEIGKSAYMGSENLILACDFQNLSIAGIQTDTDNALQQTIIGGNIQACGIGINVIGGSAPVVSGVGFQANSSWDISVQTSSINSMHVTGCRSESVNFFYITGGSFASLHDNDHQGPSAGTFACYESGMGVVSGCRTLYGSFLGNNSAVIKLQNSMFPSGFLKLRQLWPNSPTDIAPGCIELENVLNGGQLIKRQKIFSGYPYGELVNIVRNYELEALSLSDPSLVGYPISVGDAVANAQPVAGDPLGWVCVASGLFGSTAVMAPTGVVS